MWRGRWAAGKDWECGHLPWVSLGGWQVRLMQGGLGPALCPTHSLRCTHCELTLSPPHIHPGVHTPTNPWNTSTVSCANKWQWWHVDSCMRAGCSSQWTCIRNAGTAEQQGERTLDHLIQLPHGIEKLRTP